MGHVSGAGCGAANGAEGARLGGGVGSGGVPSWALRLSSRWIGRWPCGWREGVGREGATGRGGLRAGGMMQSTARGQANPSLHLTRAFGALLYRGSLHCRGAVYTWGCTPHGAGR
jgi:hypothetical protein